MCEISDYWCSCARDVEKYERRRMQFSSPDSSVTLACRYRILDGSSRGDQSERGRQVRWGGKNLNFGPAAEQNT